VIRTSTRLAFAFALTLVAAPHVFAQASAGNTDAVLRPAEPDFALVSLPTALRLPRFGSAFHLTHRFSLPLNHTPSGENFGRLFGIDSSAITGLEYRVGLMRNLQAGIHHSGDNRTWSFFGQYGMVRQDHGLPVDLTAFASIDIPRVPVAGTTTFKRQASPTLAVIVSHTLKQRAAVYLEPIVAGHLFNEFGTPSTSDNAFLVGFGGRIRVRPTVYVVAEAVPRVSGFKANTNHAAVGIEKRAGGHVFQLNFSNSFGTILSQLAQGGAPANNWHLGFNLTRKFL
jgi:hypothetical protein